MATKSKPTMAVKIYGPFKIYFDDQAESFSGVNATGPFDILPGHKNFMSLLKPSTLKVVRTDGQVFSLNIVRGVMHVRANKVSVFLDV